jgi:NodT family efflux transporter outer membrane factor (OMF) lipoprotein
VVRLAVVCGWLLPASGCGLSQWVHNGFKVGPNYAPPCAAVADNWIDSDDPRVMDQPPDYAEWWSVFQDPALNNLVETAYRQNLTLREAGFRVTQARAARALAVGGLFPQVQQITGDYTREQISVLQQPALLPIPGLFSRSFDRWSFGGNLSWELDTWGRFRRAVESADANLSGSVHQYDAILICLIAEVVTAYTDIRTFEQRLQYARENVRIQEGSLELAQARSAAGKTGDISLHLSQSNLEGTTAAIPFLETGLRQANNRLCTLLGMPTTDLAQLIGAGDGIPTAPREVAVGIPADLLRRRPDVRAAESQVAAQSAQIGVAISDLYPGIAITGQISTTSEESKNLFKSLTNGGSVGPSFQWNVLNYGRIRNNISIQQAAFQELVASYQNTVLTANQEVEDSLVAFLRTQNAVASLGRSANETQRALELQLINFKEGESDFTGVFVLQGDLVQKQDQLAAAQGEVVTSLISLYKALGGGWEVRCRGFQGQRFQAQDTMTAAEEMIEDVPPPVATPPLSDPAIESLPEPPIR